MSTRSRLETGLKSAMRGRDSVAVTTLRSLIGAIDNAGAVPAETGPYEVKLGLGHDVARRELTESQIALIIEAERDDLIAASEQYRLLGEHQRAEELARQAEIAGGYLT
ncbi:MAG TPA: hypothetical protein VI141_03960 [Acidimicrobiia bacterium]